MVLYNSPDWPESDPNNLCVDKWKSSVGKLSDVDPAVLLEKMTVCSKTSQHRDAQLCLPLPSASDHQSHEPSMN